MHRTSSHERFTIWSSSAGGSASQAVSRNHWVTLKHEPVAGWEITFPPVRESNVNSLLEFTRGVLAVGEATQVYRVLEVPGEPGFRADSGQTYVDYLRAMLDRNGVLPLLPTSGGAAPTARGQLRTPGRVAYFDTAGSAVEEEVADYADGPERIYEWDEKES